MTKLLVAGATGLVGGAVLNLVLADPRVTRVVAPTRRPLPAHPKLRNPIANADDLPRDADWWSVDTAICALGTTRKTAGSAAAFRAIDHDYALAVAEGVRAGGADRFALTSSTGADARSPLLYPRTKGQVEDAITALGFPSLTIVRPGLLGGQRSEHRLMERIMATILRTLAPILPASAQISPASTVAALLVDAALAGERGRHIIGPAEIARRARTLR